MRHAFTPLRAHMSASSRSATSTTVMPPTSSLASAYGPVGDEDVSIGLGAQRACRAQASGEAPDAGSDHFAVERVNLVHRRFGHRGRIEVLEEIPGKQVVRHVRLLQWFPVGPVALPQSLRRAAEPKIDRSCKKSLRASMSGFAPIGLRRPEQSIPFVALWASRSNRDGRPA